MHKNTITSIHTFAMGKCTFYRNSTVASPFGKVVSTMLLLLLLPVASWAQRIDCSFVTPEIVRVQWSEDGKLGGNHTGICVYQPQKVKVKETRKGSCRVLTSSALAVTIDTLTQSVTFTDRATGRVLLSETSRSSEKVLREQTVYDDGSAHTEETANGKVTVKEAVGRDTVGTATRYISHFSCPGTKALYGLGAHMEDYMNLCGKTLWLTQHNLKVCIPMLISPQGYGLLFDAGCAMKFTSGEGWFDMQLEAAHQSDYYFILGPRMDDVVAGYHHLTGKVQLLPLYAFGYVQSKERHVSSDDLIQTLKEYRRRHVPIDMIVQDWSYWPEGWGYMKMDPRYYPDPKALADSIHAMNAKLMVSIWPNPQYCPEERDFRERGYMLEHSVYDAFNPAARDHYWKYANETFFSQGFDAWWTDCSEPLDADWKAMPEVNGHPYGRDDQEMRWHLNKNLLSEALGAERSSLYSLYHARGIYENQRKTSEAKRVLNLTRSGYAGQQRYATVVWNGDNYASWKSFRQQIPAGLNYMATGNPYWTVDVGCFFVRNDGYRWFWCGEFDRGVDDDAYKEFYTRMFQWATFLPMLRSHGTETPREIWRFGEPGTPYYDAILKMIHLRYRLLPYIYSLAAHQTMYSQTMARPLAFDYPNDKQVYDLKDEYLFGSFLVCPVTHPLNEKSERRIYLPEGNQWIDFWTNTRYAGGQWIDVQVSIDRLPLFVKCGSIVPTTEVVEYAAAQQDKPITVEVFPGQDATFILYEDAGDGYAFEQGQYTETRLTWNDKRQKLTVKGKTKRPIKIVVRTPKERP